MEKVRKAAERMLYPPAGIRVIIFVIGFGSLIPAFLSGLSQTGFVYAAYVGSAYALAVAVAWTVEIVRDAKKIKGHLMRKNHMLERYLTDPWFRVLAGMRLSLLINVFYAVLKAVTAVLASSAWTGAMAAYYIALCTARIYLMTTFLKEKRGAVHNREKELLYYRNTGIFLLFVNAALSVLIYKIVQEGETYVYPGYIIYAYAGYSFYSVGSSIYHKIKYRRFKSPLLSASKEISVTTALVSVVSLQTAMLTQFGTETDFSHRMANALTGTAVCIAVLLISISMLVRSSKRKENAKKEAEG